MLMMLVQLLIQLVIGTVKLAIQLAMGAAYLLGALISALIGALWRAWADRHAGKVPLRAPETIGEDRVSPPPPARRASFTPRPLRPRARR